MSAGRRAFSLKRLRGWFFAFGAIFCLLSPLATVAQDQDSPVDIVEQSGQAPISSPRQQDSNNLSALFYEQQLLQNEVKKLRGELEELGHRLDELARQQSAQYLDMDRRLQNLGAVADPKTTADIETEASDTNPSNPASPLEQPSQSLSEEDAYQQAFALIEGRQFEQAVSAYDQFLIRYPNGKFTPNAFYWLGEIHLRLEDLEKSRQSFVQVLTLYPAHQKVPDALFKLGIVYDRLGDRETAESHLQRAIREHPRTTAAQLATEYLRERK